MNFEYDVVIIGAGPIGSTIAFYLAKEDLNVAVVEKKTHVGYPLQCAGILSRHIRQLNDLPDEIIMNTVKGAYIHSNDNILKVEKDYDAAYVIDRISYDNYLMERAIDSGVKLINRKAISFDIDNGVTFLENDEKITSKVIIGCDGHNSKLSDCLGNIQNNFNATQVLVEIKDISHYRQSDLNNDDYVDTIICEDILPGFIWIIPLKNNLYRLGLFSNDSHQIQKSKIMDFLNENFTYELKEKYKGFIPIFTQDNRLVHKRAVLIGDAAAQVKPTSGGGLLIGFDACCIAKDYIIESIRQDDINILKGYEKEFLNKYLKEFNYQFKVQKTFNILSEDDFEYLFNKLKENDCEEIISEYGDMDNQSVVVKEFIKRGLIFKILPSFLFLKVSKIFGFR